MRTLRLVAILVIVVAMDALAQTSNEVKGSAEQKTIRAHVEIACFQTDEQALCAQIRSLLESEIRNLDAVRVVDDDWMFEVHVGVFAYPNRLTTLPAVFCQSSHDEIGLPVNIEASISLYQVPPAEYATMATNLARAFAGTMLSPTRNNERLLAFRTAQHFMFRSLADSRK